MVEVRLGAETELEVEVTRRRDVEKNEPRSTRRETGRAVGIDGVVTMETKKQEEEEEEERRRELLPDTKNCVIAIARLRPDGLKEEGLGGRGRSRDPEPDSDWTRSPEWNDRRRSKRFVKKVEVKVQVDRAPAGVPRRPRALRLTRCHDVTADPAHRRCPKRRKDDGDIIDPSEPCTSNQSDDGRPPSRRGRKDSRRRPTEKKNPPNVALKKTTSTMTNQNEESPPKYSASPFRKRRVACHRCPACIREDCGKCVFCRDMKKFGGPSTKKQRCRFRRCLVLVKKRRRRRRRRRREGRESEEHDWSELLMKKEEEEDEEEEMQPPQFPLVGGDAALPPAGHLIGMHFQLSFTLDGGHFTPSLLSDSALTCLSGLLPQDVSVLHVSTDFTFIPPPLHPLHLHPKEEEEAVEIDLCRGDGAEGGVAELMEAGLMEEVCREGATETEVYFDVEVEVPGSDSDEETPTTSSIPSDITDDVTASDVVTYEPPEFISLSSGSFSLFGGGAGDDVEGGRGLLCLLRALRSAVLPAHWVAVLTDGPELQLLQSSRLSSMTDTVVHVPPDFCFYVSVARRRLPDTHTLNYTHTHKITHLSQLVSLLLDLEQLIVCRGSKVRFPVSQLQVRSPACQLLVAPPRLTCRPCLEN